MGFRLVPTSVTLNGLKRHYDVILRLSNWMARLPEFSFRQYTSNHVLSIYVSCAFVWQRTCIYLCACLLFTTLSLKILTDREKN